MKKLILVVSFLVVGGLTFPNRAPAYQPNTYRLPAVITNQLNMLLERADKAIGQ